MVRHGRLDGAGGPDAARPALVLALLLAACAPVEPTPEQRTDAALTSALAYLEAHQAEDGTWASETYGNLEDGRALTAVMAKVMLFSGRPEVSAVSADRALDALIAAARPDGTIDPGAFGLAYPVYTASLAAIALSRPNVADRPDAGRALKAWVQLLREHQLDEDLGWRPEDAAWGGWGYSLAPPERPAPGAEPAPFDADLSSTLFAVGALRLAGAGAQDPAVERARAFVERCQNFGTGEPAFDDGGFFFTPTNAHQNKAGVAGTGSAGRVRYHSYGAMTADGVRALLRCGLEPGHPRVKAAERWLAQHFDVGSNPGTYDPARELERDASYYYWCWSLAHALYALRVTQLETPAGPVDWRAELMRELLARQGPDGSWTNATTMVKEDDPLVATAFAAAALSLCRLPMPAAEE